MTDTRKPFAAWTAERPFRRLRIPGSRRRTATVWPETYDANGLPSEAFAWSANGGGDIVCGVELTEDAAKIAAETWLAEHVPTPVWSHDDLCAWRLDLGGGRKAMVLDSDGVSDWGAWSNGAFGHGETGDVDLSKCEAERWLREHP